MLQKLRYVGRTAQMSYTSFRFPITSAEAIQRPCCFSTSERILRKVHERKSAKEMESEETKTPIKKKKKSLAQATEKRQIVYVKKYMTIHQLAHAIGSTPDKIHQACFAMGKRIDKTKPLPFQLISSLVWNFGYKAELPKKNQSEVKEQTVEDKDVKPRPEPDASARELRKRPPVVTIMGHVDHGKTTLLDTLRNSRVVDQEFGGITQHIGAFSVEVESGESITFLDTPGHAAFSSMRQRGASVTDIVILVIAAEDGVMQQTIESIKHAQAAGVSIIVAINKIDKPGADVEKTKHMLLKQGVQLEETGGDVQCVPISALKGTNVDQLKQAIVAEAEILDLKCDPTGHAEGYIIESSTDPGKGRVATALIQRGSLRKGACVVSGTCWAKVRTMRNAHGRLVQQALPSQAVELTGWKGQPAAGDRLLQVTSEKQALEVVRYRETLLMDEKAERDMAAWKEQQKIHNELYTDLRDSFREEYFQKRGILPKRKPIFKNYELLGGKSKEAVQSDEGPSVSVVVKGDVDGSVEAILNILYSYPGQQCQLHVLSHGVGPVTEADLTTADTFNGVIYAFNVDVDPTVKQNVDYKEVKIRHFNIIYELIDDLKEELTKQLIPVQHDRVLGTASVQQMFKITERKTKVVVVGCKCDSGVLHKDKLYRVFRNDIEVFKGGCASMRHLKKEVDSTSIDVECGLKFRPEFEAQPGDIVKCYEHYFVEQALDWQLNF